MSDRTWPYIELVDAFEGVLADVGDVVVLEVDHDGVLRDLPRDGDQACKHDSRLNAFHSSFRRKL